MKKSKLLILGLDGVSIELIEHFTATGVMPHLAELLQRGRCVPMSVSIPDISSVSWSSFMTGTDAGNHGIFGFADLVPGTYKLRFPDFRDLQCPTLFDELGKQGKRSVVISLPATYPARQFPGILISGFFATELEKAVYPLSYYPFLKEMHYEIDVDSAKGKNQKMEFLADLHYCLKVKKEVADILWKNEEWDIFMFTVTETDRLHHFLFDASHDSTHFFHREFLQFYQEVDAFIGDFCQKLKAFPEHEIVLLSDHGFAPVRREVYINPILKKHGIYVNPVSDQRNLEHLLPSTKAFALDPARIFVNLAGKFPSGRVRKSDYEKVRRDLRDFFLELSIDGVKAVRSVLFKEEIYSAPLLGFAADLILLGNPGYDLKAGIEKSEPFADSLFAGMHRYDNALFFCTRPRLIPEAMTIFKVKGIIEKLAQ